MTKPRVAYLTDTIADVRLLEGLAGRFELTLVTRRALGRRAVTGETSGRVRQVLLPGGRIGFMIRSAAWMAARARDYDLIFALDNLTAALAANAAGLLRRRPVILQMGRPTERYFRTKRRAGMGPVRFRLGLVAVKSLVGVNERLATAIGAVCEDVASECRMRARHVVVTGSCGVDPAAFTPGRGRGEARRALGLPGEGALVLFRSRLAPEKDPDTFLRAMRLLLEEGRDVTALFVGAEFRELETMAARVGVPAIGRNHVHPLTELPHYYRAATLTVQTSHEEGLARSPLESLACHTPAVVTRVGGLVEVAQGGETALLVPPRNPEATARAISWVLDHPEKAAEMARRGRKAVIDTFSTQRAFDAWERLANEVAGTRRRGGSKGTK